MTDLLKMLHDERATLVNLPLIALWAALGQWEFQQ